jgi:hypothetical protein
MAKTIFLNALAFKISIKFYPKSLSDKDIYMKFLNIRSYILPKWPRVHFMVIWTAFLLWFGIPSKNHIEINPYGTEKLGLPGSK